MLVYQHVNGLLLFCQALYYPVPRRSHTAALNVSGSKWNCMAVQQHLHIDVKTFVMIHGGAYRLILSGLEKHCKLAQSACYIYHSKPKFNSGYTQA
jgi:hypothetical protein